MTQGYIAVPLLSWFFTVESPSHSRTPYLNNIKRPAFKSQRCLFCASARFGFGPSAPRGYTVGVSAIGPMSCTCACPGAAMTFGGPADEPATDVQAGPEQGGFAVASSGPHMSLLASPLDGRANGPCTHCSMLPGSSTVRDRLFAGFFFTVPCDAASSLSAKAGGFHRVMSYFLQEGPSTKRLRFRMRVCVRRDEVN